MSWKRVDEFGPEIAAEYWNRVSYYDLGYPDDLIEFAGAEADDCDWLGESI